MNLSPIYSLFQQAINAKLRYPELSLRADCGVTVKVKLAGSQSRYAGQLMVTNGERYGAPSAKYFGRIESDGLFFDAGRPNVTETEARSVTAVLEELAKDPVATAQKYAKLTGACMFCGQALTDARSLAVAYGPICAKHWNLPWGTGKIAPSASELDSARKRLAAIRVAINELVNQRAALESEALELAEVLTKAGSESATLDANGMDSVTRGELATGTE